ncbi:MAG: exodeoxyribonuclease VII small subunit [Lachnospiraceae bacterium]|nr:exodeoxyribonuclease VII small subunit [Lachnospiraceae bacterium]
MTEKKDEKQLSLEESFEQLSQIIHAMEDRDCSLEDSFALYTKGISLIRDCNRRIEQVEKQIEILEGESEDGI